MNGRDAEKAARGKRKYIAYSKYRQTSGECPRNSRTGNDARATSSSDIVVATSKLDVPGYVVIRGVVDGQEATGTRAGTTVDAAGHRW